MISTMYYVRHHEKLWTLCIFRHHVTFHKTSLTIRDTMIIRIYYETLWDTMTHKTSETPWDVIRHYKRLWDIYKRLCDTINPHTNCTHAVTVEDLNTPCSWYHFRHVSRRSLYQQCMMLLCNAVAYSWRTIHINSNSWLANSVIHTSFVVWWRWSLT